MSDLVKPTDPEAKALADLLTADDWEDQFAALIEKAFGPESMRDEE